MATPDNLTIVKPIENLINISITDDAIRKEIYHMF